MKPVLLLFIVLPLWQCPARASAIYSRHNRAAMLLPDSIPPAGAYHYEIFARPDGAYGYDIFSGTKKLIHQPSVPGQPGNKGFAGRGAAAKVAGLIIGKLERNIFPPTVTTAELKQLHVL
jgi:hypothetical protein